jgi:hypothetical protein
MNYRLVYDVLNDTTFPWFGVFFAIVPLLLVAASCLELVDRVRGGGPTSALPRGLHTIPIAGLVVAILILSLFGFFSASKTYEGFVQRQQCKEWARAGQYQVTEGAIADYELRKAGATFRVADFSFDLLNRSAGFTGRFNAGAAAQDLLRDGLRVRLAHRDGFILRVEVALER